MPKATHAHSTPADCPPNTSRRAMIAGSGSALLLIAGAAPISRAEATTISGAQPDAALIAACADYHAARAEEERISTSPPRPDDEARVNAIIERLNRAYEAAATLPARTVAGLQAKAGLIRVDLPRAIEDFEMTPEAPEIRVVLSLAADILRGGQA